MKIAIVDDDRGFAEQVSDSCKQILKELEETPELFLTDGYTLIDRLQDGRNYDAYLLDVEMPGRTGLELAKEVFRYHRDARIVFLTSHEEYALRSIHIGTYYYILKETYQEELKGLLERILKEIRIDEGYYVISSEQKTFRILHKRILYLEKNGKYTYFHCVDDAQYRERNTLEKVYERLPQDQFIYINPGNIINMRHVSEISALEITLKDTDNTDIILPISRRMKSEVRGKLARYWGK